MKRHVMDTTTPMIYEIVFHYNSDWVEFYWDVEGEYPSQITEPIGEPVSTSNFVDSNHDSNVATRRSHKGILFFVFNGLIRAFRKRHNNDKSSTFGSDLVALRITRDLIVELRIKLDSVGVTLRGPTYVYCDNQ